MSVFSVSIFLVIRRDKELEGGVGETGISNWKIIVKMVFERLIPG